MIKALFALALCIAAFGAVPARAANSADNDQLRSALQARYEAVQTATDKRDGKALGDLLAPGFETISMKNEAKGRDQMIHDIGALGPKNPGTTVTTVINDIRQVGDKAYVDETYRLDRVNPPRNGIAHKWRVNTNVNDVWVKTKGEWLLEKSIASMTDFYVDGQHMAHQLRGRKMMIDKTYREKMKKKKAAAAVPAGGSCGITNSCHSTPLPMSPIPPSSGH